MILRGRTAVVKTMTKLGPREQRFKIERVAKGKDGRVDLISGRVIRERDGKLGKIRMVVYGWVLRGGDRNKHVEIEER